MIGTLVDAPATMVNAVGDNVTSMMVARVLGGKQDGGARVGALRQAQRPKGRGTRCKAQGARDKEKSCYFFLPVLSSL